MYIYIYIYIYISLVGSSRRFDKKNRAQRTYGGSCHGHMGQILLGVKIVGSFAVAVN